MWTNESLTVTEIEDQTALKIARWMLNSVDPEWTSLYDSELISNFAHDIMRGDWRDE